MRQRLLIGLLGVALAAAVLFPFAKSGAQRAPRKPEVVPTTPEWVGLPNYDKRLAGRAEFTDSDLSSAVGRQQAAAGNDGNHGDGAGHGHGFLHDAR